MPGGGTGAILTGTNSSLIHGLVDHLADVAQGVAYALQLAR